ncbi:MAG: hypothetical protein AAB562_04855 [Patescibacteria group bacterium]
MTVTCQYYAIFWADERVKLILRGKETKHYRLKNSVFFQSTS